MSTLVLTVSDAAGLRRLEEAMASMTRRKVQQAGARAFNHTGRKAWTQTRRALAGQTGLKSGLIARWSRVDRAVPSRLAYRITTQGRDIPLKYFDARETRKGVSAAPLGQRTVFAGTFLKGGRFPNRVDLRMNGHVFARTSKDRLPLEKIKSGVVLPREMVRDASARAWNGMVAGALPGRVLHELKFLGGGIFT